MRKVIAPTTLMENKFTKEALTDYLLGKLSVEQTEEFDELSITDDDFADNLKSAENDLVDSYNRRELKNPDLERFEAYYLASPLRREKVEFAKNLQEIAGKKIARNNWDETEDSPSIFASIFAFLTPLRIGFAVLAVTFLSFVGWILIQNTNKNPEIVEVKPTPTPTISTTIQPTQIPTVEPTNSPNQKISPMPTPKIEPTKEPSVSPTPKVEPNKEVTSNVPTLATFVLLPPIRGGGNVQTISIPEKTTDVAFNLPLESDDFKIYRVILKTQSGKILWQSGRLNSKKSALNVRFPAKFLQSNIYNFTVSGISETGAAENIGDYSFRTVLK